MVFKNPITNQSFELDGVAADFFGRALEKFHNNTRWSAFESFAFSPTSPIYARRKSYGRLVRDPLYRALQDMWLQLGVNQGEVQDDRPNGEKAFCHEAGKEPERAGRAPAARTVLR
jgi:hypothetical protein